jgi:hypothetical protein
VTSLERGGRGGGGGGGSNEKTHSKGQMICLNIMGKKKYIHIKERGGGGGGGGGGAEPSRIAMKQSFIHATLPPLK